MRLVKRLAQFCRSNWGAALAGATGGAFLLSAVWLARQGAWLHWIEAHSALAVWVQALLSVLALLAVAWFQDRAIEARFRRERRERLSGIAGAIRLAESLIMDADAAVKADHFAYKRYVQNQAVTRAMTQTLNALERIPLHDLPDSDQAIALHNLQVVLRDLAHDIEEFRKVAGGTTTIRFNPSAAVHEVDQTKSIFERAWAAVGGK